MPRRRAKPRAESRADREFVSEAEEILERMRGDLADLSDRCSDGSEIDPELAALVPGRYARNERGAEVVRLVL